MRDDSRLDQFLNREYVRLETFKRNGQIVPTPVWFVVTTTLFSSGRTRIAARSSACAMTPT